jgi:hypothetical protein
MKVEHNVISDQPFAHEMGEKLTQQVTFTLLPAPPIPQTFSKQTEKSSRLQRENANHKHHVVNQA